MCEKIMHCINTAYCKILRLITDSPWFVTNKTLRDDLKIEFSDRVIKITNVQQFLKLKDQSNSKVIFLRHSHQEISYS